MFWDVFFSGSQVWRCPSPQRNKVHVLAFSLSLHRHPYNVFPSDLVVPIYNKQIHLGHFCWQRHEDDCGPECEMWEKTWKLSTVIFPFPNDYSYRWYPLCCQGGTHQMLDDMCVYVRNTPLLKIVALEDVTNPQCTKFEVNQTNASSNFKIHQ